MDDILIERQLTYNNNKTHKVLPEIIEVAQLLSYTNIRFPTYQRPYKWETKNVIQLIDDIIVHKGKSAYRLLTLFLLFPVLAVNFHVFAEVHFFYHPLY